MNGEDLVPARMNVEQFQGHVLAELRTIGREIHDLKEEMHKQESKLSDYGVSCAEKRSDIREEIRKATWKVAFMTLGICVSTFGLAAGLYFGFR